LEDKTAQSGFIFLSCLPGSIKQSTSPGCGTKAKNTKLMGQRTGSARSITTVKSKQRIIFVGTAFEMPVNIRHLPLHVGPARKGKHDVDWRLISGRTFQLGSLSRQHSTCI